MAVSIKITDGPEAAAAPGAPASPRRVTFEEYLTLDDERTMSEWVDGEVIYMSPASRRHQEILSFLVTVIGIYVDTHAYGVMLPAPFAMKLEALKRGREPDVLFVSSGRQHLVEKTFLNGPADLVVEIVSPESVGRDRGQKFVEYEAAGISEYWLIDPDRESAEFYELGADGRYRAAQVAAGDAYRSKVIPGFFARPEWFWQTPSPTLDALREMKLM